MEEIVYPTIYRVSYIPGECLGYVGYFPSTVCQWEWLRHEGMRIFVNEC